MVGDGLVEAAGATLGLAASLAAVLVGLVAIAQAELLPSRPRR